MLTCHDCWHVIDYEFLKHRLLVVGLTGLLEVHSWAVESIVKKHQLWTLDTLSFSLLCRIPLRGFKPVNTWAVEGKRHQNTIRLVFLGYFQKSFSVHFHGHFAAAVILLWWSSLHRLMLRACLSPLQLFNRGECKPSLSNSQFRACFVGT